MDKAGKKYWNDEWVSSEIPSAVDPSDMLCKNYVNRRFHNFFMTLFDKSETASMKLLEIGCARSAWLPYFAKEFGFGVVGIDYSPVGCQMAKEVLRSSGIRGEIVCSDLFSPPQGMLGEFDVVVSFGVIEHFDDTEYCLKAVSSFLKPGGILITNIPNMVGCNGYLQKVINKPVYDIHQLISSSSLRASHASAGLEVLDCDYFIFNSFGVCNLNGVPLNTLSGILKKVVLGFLARVSMVVWSIEHAIGSFSANKYTSPYINCVARKI